VRVNAGGELRGVCSAIASVISSGTMQMGAFSRVSVEVTLLTQISR
jgi:hypothetical protein